MGGPATREHSGVDGSSIHDELSLDDRSTAGWDARAVHAAWRALGSAAVDGEETQLAEG
jgi:hypothetical protein